MKCHTVQGSHHAGPIRWLIEEELRLAKLIADELERYTALWLKPKGDAE